MRIEQHAPSAAELDELFPEARLLTLVREADTNAPAGDSYVVADVIGDVGGSTTPASAPVNYAPRWHAHLGNAERAR